MKQIVLWLLAAMLAVAAVSCKKDNPTPVDPVNPGNGNGNGSGTAIVIPGPDGKDITVPDSLKKFFVYLPGTKNFNVDSLMAGYAAVIRRAGGYSRAQVPDKLEYFIVNGGLVSPTLTLQSGPITPLVLLDLNKIRFERHPNQGEFFGIPDKLALPFNMAPKFATFAWHVSPRTPTGGVRPAGIGMTLRVAPDATKPNLDIEEVWRIVVPPK